MDAHFRSFEGDVVPRLVKQGIAVLGMKPIGDGLVLKSGTVNGIECLHYARPEPWNICLSGYRNASTSGRSRSHQRPSGAAC